MQFLKRTLLLVIIVVIAKTYAVGLAPATKLMYFKPGSSPQTVDFQAYVSDKDSSGVILWSVILSGEYMDLHYASFSQDSIVTEILMESPVAPGGGGWFYGSFYVDGSKLPTNILDYHKLYYSVYDEPSGGGGTIGVGMVAVGTGKIFNTPYEINDLTVQSLDGSSSNVVLNWSHAITENVEISKYFIVRSVDTPINLENMELGTIIVDSLDANTTQYIDTSGLNPVNYYYTVFGVRDNGDIVVSSSGIFISNIKPHTFELLTPSQLGYSDSLNIKFNWTDSYCEWNFTYRLKYSTDSTFTSCSVVDNISISEYSVTEPLLNDSKYYWTVEAVTDNGFVTFGSSIQNINTINKGATITASSSFPGQPVINAIDENPTTYWEESINYGTSTTFNRVITCTLPKSISLSRIKLVQLQSNLIRHADIVPWDIVNEKWDTDNRLYVAKGNVGDDYFSDFTFTPYETNKVQLNLYRATSTHKIRLYSIELYSNVGEFYTHTPGFPPNPIPDVPTLVSPADLSSTTDLRPTFDWDDVSGATSYTILVDNNSDYSSPDIIQTSITSSYTPSINLTPGSYYWKVLAMDEYGSSAYSSNWHFTINPLPSVPTLLSPADLSSTTDLRPTFNWDDVSGVTSYTILVDNDSSFSSPEINQITTVSNYIPENDLAYGTYYWKVLATNNFGSSAYSNAFRVTLYSIPEAPTLLAPADSSITYDPTITFDWSYVSGANSYTILVDNDSNFSSPEINQITTVSNYIPENDLAFGTYYWKVSASNTYATGLYSSIWTLTIRELPPSPTDLSASVNGADVSLTWRAPETLKCKFEHDTKSENPTQTGYKVYRNENLIATITNPDILSYDDISLYKGDYSYYVTATYTGQIESEGSNVSNVAIGEFASLLLSYQNGNIKLTWNEVPDTELYYIFSNSNPSTEFSLVDSTVTNEWNNATTQDRQFYYVTRKFITSEELIYDTGTVEGFYIWPGGTMATRMSPSKAGKIIKLKYYTSSNGNFNAEVYGWTESQPGTKLHTVTVNALSNSWTEVDVTSSNITFTADFVVGFGGINETTGIGYHNYNNSRSWYSGGNWSTWSESYLIRAVVEYDDGKTMVLDGSLITPVKSLKNNETEKSSNQKLSIPLN